MEKYTPPYAIHIHIFIIPLHVSTPPGHHQVLQNQKKATKVSCSPVDPRGNKSHKNNNKILILKN
jgi:hypothetical protein